MIEMLFPDIKMILDDGSIWIDAPYSMYMGGDSSGKQILQKIEKQGFLWFKIDKFIEIDSFDNETIIRRL